MHPVPCTRRLIDEQNSGASPNLQGPYTALLRWWRFIGALKRLSVAQGLRLAGFAPRCPAAQGCGGALEQLLATFAEFYSWLQVLELLYDEFQERFPEAQSASSK